MSILITLTTEGADREDGNVYYARHLIVDAPSADGDAVRQVVRDSLRCNAALEVDGDDPVAKQRFDDTQGLAAALSAAGYPAEVAAAILVVSQHG